MEIPADSESEAREKAHEFIISRTEVVIETCEMKREEEAKSGKTLWEGQGAMGELLKNWPFGPKKP